MTSGRTTPAEVGDREPEGRLRGEDGKTRGPLIEEVSRR